MTWKSHQILTLGFGLYLSLAPLSLLSALLGSILPDLCDQRFAAFLARSRRERAFYFAKVHRGFSHWFGLWLVLLWVTELLGPPWALFTLGLAFGALLHIFFDALTPMGVPLFPFACSFRLGYPLCRTASLGEYVLVGLILALLVFFGQEQILACLVQLETSINRFF